MTTGETEGVSAAGGAAESAGLIRYRYDSTSTEHSTMTAPTSCLVLIVRLAPCGVEART